MDCAPPNFPVALTPPDLAPWQAGNTGIAGFLRFESSRPGPHVVLVSLIHGNELAGALALDALLRAEFRPACGAVTFGFANMDAMARFDPRHPTASRFIDEDLNRVWDPAVLAGPRQSMELRRARDMLPLLQGCDLLLDLHSMLWPSVPLILSGPTPRGRDLARMLGKPGLVVADTGHASGRRLIDWPGFTDPKGKQAAVLVEAGQHWQQATVDCTLACIAGLLHATGQAGDHPALPPRAALPPQSFARVTKTVTANTSRFAFEQPFRGGEIIAERGTLLAHDGPQEIRTPYDNCLLVMPSMRPGRGHTAVRLACVEKPATADPAAAE